MDGPGTLFDNPSGRKNSQKNNQYPNHSRYNWMGSDPKIGSMNCWWSAEFCKKFCKWAPFKGVLVYKPYIVFVVIHLKTSPVFGLQVRCWELYIFKIRNFLRNCLEIFWIYSGFLRGIFWIFFGRVFWDEFFGRIFWEESIVYIVKVS